VLSKVEIFNLLRGILVGNLWVDNRKLQKIDVWVGDFLMEVKMVSFVDGFE